jgi:hypothetical protein
VSLKAYAGTKVHLYLLTEQLLVEVAGGSDVLDKDYERLVGDIHQFHLLDIIPI